MRLSLLALGLFLVACNPDSSDNKNVSSTLTVQNQSLLFSAIDPSAYPYQASLFKLDLATKKVSDVLTGESGDTAVFASGDSALFFNRSAESQNFRLLSPEVDTYLLSPQLRFAKGSVGDPHDALNLGNDQVLLAHYVQGALTVMHQKSGAEIQTVEAEWDLPAGVPFKPETLLPVKRDGKSFIYVVHQGAAFDANGYATNGSQQIFVLEQVGDKLNALDLDPATAKVQGIKVKGSIPAAVRFNSREKILLVSMCSRYLAPTSPCHSAIEEVDTKTNTSHVLWDLDNSPYFMNGAVTPGPTKDIVFVAVEEQISADTYKRRLLRMDAKQQSAVVAYNYGEGSGGYYPAFFDEGSQTLFVSDIAKDSIGKFVVIPEFGERSEIALPLVPYSGAFLSAPAK